MAPARRGSRHRPRARGEDSVAHVGGTELRARERAGLGPAKAPDGLHFRPSWAMPSAPAYADVAQLVEQLIRNQQVPGSSPGVGSG